MFTYVLYSKKVVPPKLSLYRNVYTAVYKERKISSFSLVHLHFPLHCIIIQVANKFIVIY